MARTMMRLGRRVAKTAPEIRGRATFTGYKNADYEMAMRYAVPISIVLRRETADRYAAYWEGGQPLMRMDAKEKIRGPLADVKAAVRARFETQHGPWTWTKDGTTIAESSEEKKRK